MIFWKDDLQSTDALILLFTIELYYFSKKKKKKKGVDCQKWTYNNVFRFYLSIQSEFCWILQAINPLELAMEALKEIQSRFYRDFPPHPKEQVYGFATPSTMKPTQWSCKFPCLYWQCWGKRKSLSFYHVQFFIADPGGGINQIPAECTISGDVRFIILSNPFEYRPLTEMMSYWGFFLSSSLLFCRLTPFYK